MSDADINLSGINLTSNANERGRADAGIHKTTIIIIVGIFVVAVLGGGYFYYRNVYQPKIYTRALVPLYESAGLLGGETALSGATPRGPINPLDYAGAAEHIATRAKKLHTARTEIATVKPPNAALAEFHASLLEVFDLAVRASKEAEERAQFFAKLLVLKEEMNSLRTIVSTPQANIHIVGDLKEAWLPHLRAARTTGTDAFSKKIRAWGTSDAAIATIITLWDETAPDIDFLIETLGTFQNSVRVEEFGTLLTPEQSTRGEKGFRRIEQLIEIIGNLTTAQSAQTLLDISTVSGETQAAFSEKVYQTYREFEELKRRYLPS